MAETALRSSCLATKGHKIQLMTTAATTPTTNARPWLIAMVTGDSPSVINLSEVTVNDRHPTSPDLCYVVSHGPCQMDSAGLTYRVRALSEAIEHRKKVDRRKRTHHIRTALSGGITGSCPDSTEDTHKSSGDEILLVTSDSVTASQ